VEQSPGSMLPARSAAEVVAGYNDRCAREVGFVEDIVRILAERLERAAPEAFACHRLEPARGNDQVGVDILQAERDRPALDLADGLHQSVSGGSPLGMGPGCWGWVFLSLRRLA